MFKLSEVAVLLNIERIKIVEQMMISEDLLEGTIQKKNRITYIDIEGLKILAKIFNRTIDIEDKKVEPEVQEVEIEKTIDEKIKCLEAEIIKLSNLSNDLAKEIRDKDDIINEYLYLVNEDLNKYKEKDNSFIKKAFDNNQLRGG